MKVLTLLLCISLFLIIEPALAFPEVIVHDTIAIRGKEVMISVETRGKLFRKGGEVVEFFVDGKSIGKSLSGGDGFAFKQLRPLRAGLYQIAAKSGGEEGKGTLLSLRKGERIVFVDVKDGLFEGEFSERPKKGSQEAIRNLARRFPVVFLQTGLPGVEAVRTWLRENGFMSLPVIPWDEGTIFDEIKEKGLKIRAVIGGQSIIESAGENKPKAFSFGEAEGAEEVKDWKEIGKKLK